MFPKLLALLVLRKNFCEKLRVKVAHTHFSILYYAFNADKGSL